MAGAASLQNFMRLAGSREEMGAYPLHNGTLSTAEVCWLLHIAHCAWHTALCTLHSEYGTRHTTHFTRHTAHFTLKTAHYQPHTAHCRATCSPWTARALSHGGSSSCRLTIACASMEFASFLRGGPGAHATVGCPVAAVCSCMVPTERCTP